MQFAALEPACLAQVVSHCAGVYTLLLTAKLYLILADTHAMIGPESSDLVPVDHVIGLRLNLWTAHGSLAREAALQGQRDALCVHHLGVARMNKIYFDWNLLVRLSCMVFDPPGCNRSRSLGLIAVV